MTTLAQSRRQSQTLSAMAPAQTMTTALVPAAPMIAMRTTSKRSERRSQCNPLHLYCPPPPRPANSLLPQQQMYLCMLRAVRADHVPFMLFAQSCLGLHSWSFNTTRVFWQCTLTQGLMPGVTSQIR